ncbi:MAG: molybdenum cofactor synthesis domain-containing protein [Planctomycetota bacterium]|jgi:molybdenum cofactor synthesis domain-containing protein
MSNKGTILSVNVSTEKGVVKSPVSQVEMNGLGIVGDAHAGQWQRQVSLLSQEQIDIFTKETGKDIQPGQFAENLTVSGLPLDGVAVLDRFQIGRVELEVTQLGKRCHGDGCAIYQEVGKCVMPKEGVFCRVIQGGTVKPGDSIEYTPRGLKISVVTLSDRAFSGVYPDRSGPRVTEMLNDFFKDRKQALQIENTILPDDAEKLRQALTRAIEDKVDIIFTCGGTGIGPRDIAPETVEAVCDKTIPGIMENIRIKYGQNKPSVLLSRSVAAIAGRTQIYTLPGSVRAVEEYLSEILKTLQHAILMIHCIDAH